MRRNFQSKWLPGIAPLAAAVWLAQGCHDDDRTGTAKLANSADAGADGKRSDSAGSGTAREPSSSAAGQDKPKPSEASKPPADASSDGKSDASAMSKEPKLELASSKLGFAGAFIDFDGEGRLDQLVGAQHAKRADQLGVALVYTGNEKGWSTDPSATLSGGRDFGYTVAGLGDVDGDGKHDYAVGAPHGDGGAVSLAGSVSVFAGGSKGKLLAKLDGATSASKFGLAVASGDLDGDGKADVVVGAPFHSPGSALYQTGAVYVHLGPKLDEVIALEATAEVKGLGWAVAAGDLNGDEVDDLVVSATSSAKVMVFFGGAKFAPSLNAPDVVYTSKATGFGKSLRVVADYSGDGHNELAIGAPTSVRGADRDVGNVFLVMAHGSAAPIDLDATPAAPQRFLQLDGPGLFSRFGSTLATAQDLDEDGLAELVVGAPLTDDKPGDMVGKVFIFASKGLTARDVTQAKSFAGSKQYGSFGAFVAPEASGRALVGAPRSDADRGAVHVIDLHQGSDAHLDPRVSDPDAGMEGEHDAHH